MKKIALIAALFLLLVPPLFAEGFRFSGNTEKDPLSYKPGEEIVFNVVLLKDGNRIGGVPVQWICRGDGGFHEEGTAISSETEPTVYGRD